ncbi:MAG: hypothetical protein ACYTHJ_11570 [Planctomycetota bacterium]|jgi:tetratricopeptide (TPR) repeat protein
MQSSDSHPQNRAGRHTRRSAWIVAGLALVGYANTPFNEFCDDGIHIVQRSEKITEPGGWRAIWTTDYWSDAKLEAPNRDLLYRPIALSSYRLVHDVAGPQAFPQHLVNMILHAAISVCVIWCCALIGCDSRTALVAGMIFAVLPIHADVINNVVGRADLIATLGIASTLLFHHRAFAQEGGRRWWWVLASASITFVALGAKESAAGILLIVPLFDFFLTRDRNLPAGKKILATAARCSYLVVPALVYFGLRYAALEGKLFQAPALTKTVNILVDSPPWQHALGVVQLWGMYWSKMIWPDVLSVNYSINALRLATSPLDRAFLVGVVFSVAIGVFVILRWRWRDRRPAVVLLAIILAYFPTSNLLVLIQVYFAERIWYLPSFFAVMLVAMALRPVLTRRLFGVIGMLLLVAMMGRGCIRNSEWRNNGTLYGAAYRDAPDAVGACYAYGRWIVSASDHPDELRQAIAVLHQALDIDPGFVDVQRVIGHAYLLMGDHAGALHHLQIAEMQIPGAPKTIALLEDAREQLLRHRAADLDTLRRAADTAPGNVDAELDLIRQLQQLAMLDEAIERFRQHEERFAAVPRWQHAYAVTLVLRNRRDEAIDRYRQCLAIDDKNVRVMVELTMLLIERRREADATINRESDIQSAWEIVERAAGVAPGASAVLHCKAELLALTGKLDEALEVLQRAIDALPPDSEQRRRLENRAKALGKP